jgi:hypothetical protein
METTRPSETSVDGPPGVISQKTTLRLFIIFAAALRIHPKAGSSACNPKTRHHALLVNVKIDLWRETVKFGGLWY